MVVSTSGKVVSVIGATGNQGGSVVKHLINSPEPYQLRALTRDPSKPNAKAQADKGVTVVAGDINDIAALEKLFDGANVVFAVTNFWQHNSKEKEIAEGKAIVDAAKKAGVDLLIWSGLENVTKASGGKYKHVEHFDSKSEVTEYAKSVGVPLANVQCAGYMQNHIHMIGPKKQEDGSYVLALPMKTSGVWSLIDTDADYGAYVRAVIESPELGPGSEVLACSDQVTFEELVKTWSEITGKKCVAVELDDATFQKFVPGEEMLQMLRYFQDFGYYGGKDVKPSQKHLAVKVKTWAEFVKATDWSVIG